MSDVDREALHDWLDERAGIAMDERPEPLDYEDRPLDDEDDERLEVWFDTFVEDVALPGEDSR